MPPFTLKDLLAGHMYGYHKVEQPLIGYKKIKCQYEEKIYTAVAELEIPKDAYITRYTEIDDWGDEDSVHVSDFLRTDNAIVKNIEYEDGRPVDYNNCKCFSNWDRNFMYKLNELHRPTEEFDKDNPNPMKAGIYFFFDKKTAREIYLSD
jgi:hypothetical protein